MAFRASIATTAASRPHRAISKSCAMSTTCTAAWKTTQAAKSERNNVKLISVLLLILATWLQLWAQTKRCDVGVQAPPVGFWTWPTGSNVKVYVVERDFQPSE